MKPANLAYIRKLLAGQIAHHTAQLADARDELDYARSVSEIAAAAAALADITATANEPKPVPAFEPVQRFFDRAVANASHLRDLEVYLGTSPIANGAAHNFIRDIAGIAEKPASYLAGGKDVLGDVVKEIMATPPAMLSRPRREEFTVSAPRAG